MDEKLTDGYNNGAEFWHDNAENQGEKEAAIICIRYLKANLEREHSDDERRFYREIFGAMYEATAGKINPAKLVYPYDFKIASDRMETSYYNKNRDINKECARAIDEAISASCYKTNFYHLELAAMSAISEHGFERVNAVLAHQIQKHESDGRYSSTNKKWARDFTIPEKTHTFLHSHACLIEDFVTHARKLYADMGADRYALLGTEEHGESEPVHRFVIIRSIMIDDKQGYVIGRNPDNCAPFVCWQFYIRDGERSYNWGIYGEEETAVDAYNARLFVAFN